MSTDTLARLAAANPVPDLPDIEAPERLCRLIEDEPTPPLRQPRGRQAMGIPPRVLAGLLAAILASLAVLVLADGSSGPGVNVAAAAYAATSPGSGVLEAVFVTRLLDRSHQLGDSYSSREWIDPSAGRRRQRIVLGGSRGLTLPAPRHSGGAVTYELATSPGWVETWDDLGGDSKVVHRNRFSGDEGTGAARRGAGAAPLRRSPQEAQGIELYRRLYSERSLKLVGRERLHGRLLWKLESDVAFAVYSSRPHAKLVPLAAVVMLVDPATFLPVVERQISLTQPGHPVTMESDLRSYRRLPPNAASESLLTLSKQHPGLSVLTHARARTSD
ncbi:MAG TPA: hypothetical protein VK272_04235 [Solirubrobacteraceae bacterium]|nr:hypothetical protein [Solirubrobacteraceae bacterium]